MINETLSEALGMEILPPLPKSQSIETIQEKIPEPSDENAEDRVEDYQLSRKTLKKIINIGDSALDDLHELAKDSESARAYEVLATLMKTVSETTKDLYNIQKVTKELRGVTEKRLDETNVTVDKAIFVGTTTDLLKKIRGTQESDG